MTHTSQTLRTERIGEVLLVTFSRPERMNSFTVELEHAYGDVLEAADADPEVRAIVVTGEGRAFCAGADMEDLATLAANPGEGTSPFRRRRDFPLELRKPLIAAVNGPAAGLGMVHAVYADVRFANEGAVFATGFARLGLAAEYGISWLLPRLVGRSRAMDLLLSGRKVRAQEAARIGLVDHLVDEGTDAVTAAVEYATDIATHCSPEGMALIKDQVARDCEASFEEAYQRSEELMLSRIESADMAEGVASFTERRAPRFAPLGSDA